MDTGTDLRAFRTKLIQDIRGKEAEIDDLKGKLNAVDKVLEMMAEGVSAHYSPPNNGSDPAGLYSKMGASEAVLRLINDYPDREWGVKEVRDTIIQNGFKPKTENIYNQLASTLDRFAAKDVVIMEKTDKGKRYRKNIGSSIQTTLDT